MRLMEGADVDAIAKNCRTSVEMIERFYAAHIKDTLDASVIDTRKTSDDMLRSRSRGHIGRQRTSTNDKLQAF